MSSETRREEMKRRNSTSDKLTDVYLLFALELYWELPSHIL